jgi:hypothetical protein
MKIKTPYSTIIFYMVSIAIIYTLEKLSPSGPCTPGLGAFAFLLFIPFIVVLFFRNFIKLSTSHTRHLLSAFLHLTAFTVVYIKFL